MKFGESLSEELVPEWENQYVDYKNGKKQIKRYSQLQQELEQEEVVDTTPLLDPIGEDEADSGYFVLNCEMFNDQTHLIQNQSPKELKHLPQAELVKEQNERNELNAQNGQNEQIELSELTKLSNQNKNSNLNNHRILGLNFGKSHKQNHSYCCPKLNIAPTSGRGEGSASLARRSSIFQFSSFHSRSLRREDVVKEKEKFRLWCDDELNMVNTFFREKERDIYHRFLVLEDQFAQLKEQRAEEIRHVKSKASSQSLDDPRGQVNKKFSRLTERIQKALEPLSKLELPSLPPLPSKTFLKNFKKDDDSHPDLKLESQNNQESFDPNYAENRVRNGESGYDIEADLDSLSSADVPELPNVRKTGQSDTEPSRMSFKRDFATKPPVKVPYLYARKLLKNAVVEHYRSVALVRSYRAINRTALRKITKKFDKASGCSISEPFMRKVDNTYFQTSTLLEQIQGRVEDLFLSFYGAPNDTKKHGLEKLKSATLAMQPRLYHSAAFLSGTFLGFSIPIAAIVLYIFIQDVVYKHLSVLKYLGQLWAGFFLVNLTFLLVGINFKVYTKYKINYKFIFEFNLASVLDYRQFLILPSLALAIMSFCSWFSWENFWPNEFPGINWPLVFTAMILIMVFWPGHQFYASSRRWLLVALWRICWSGFYPVEFRDFYLGDILCSLSYSLSNLSFFICLYGIEWRRCLGGGDLPNSTENCGSAHSRSMGFLSALPSIWRFLQCFRRYMDTGDTFPHSANMMKYFVGSMYYCFLSLWRIDRSDSYRALFITFASVNSVFSSAWDIIMDWSLMQPGSRNFLLRDELFYGRPIYYYLAMVSDVILRFLWVIYIAFPGQLQQLAISSFLLAVAELLRRFIWMFFRMENEHRTNVTLFRASRESPLPYFISHRVGNAIDKLVEVRYKEMEKELEDKTDIKTSHSTSTKPSILSRLSLRGRPVPKRSHGADGAFEVGSRPESKSTINAISAAFNKAHVKDFQRRKYSITGEDSDEEDVDDDLRLKPNSTR